MPGKMLSLTLHDVLHQKRLTLRGHSHKPCMQPVGTNVLRFDEIHPEDFDGGLEESLVRETHRECEDVTWFIEGIHHDANPPPLRFTDWARSSPSVWSVSAWKHMGSMTVIR